MTVQELHPGIEAAIHLHPVVFVHLPVGLWPVAVAFLGLGAMGSNARLFDVRRRLSYLAALVAPVTSVSGWIAADGLGHDSPGHGAVHEHRNWMLVALALTFATAALAFFLRHTERSAHRWPVVSALALTLGVAALGADRGACLVYAEGVGAQLQHLAPASAPSGHGQADEGDPHDH